VDDEPLAQEMIVNLLKGDPDVGLVVGCNDPGHVPDLLARHRPHIVFLDIEMPERDGLQLAGSLGDDGPVVVFVTAFARHAPRAFEVNAIDYVTKPFSDQRFFEAVGRAKRRVRERRLGELAHEVATLSAELSTDGDAGATTGTTYLQRLTLKTGNRAQVVKVSEIVWIEAEDYYVLVHSKRGRHMVRLTLASLEARLDPRRFIRVHRAAIVNVDEVRETEEKEGLLLILSDGSRVPVSRSRRPRVEPVVMPRLR
jgi:two-component system LytT family response regulator